MVVPNTGNLLAQTPVDSINGGTKRPLLLSLSHTSMLRQIVRRKVFFCCEVMWTMYLFAGIFSFIEEMGQIYEGTCHTWSLCVSF